MLSQQDSTRVNKTNLKQSYVCFLVRECGYEVSDIEICTLDEIRLASRPRIA